MLSLQTAINVFVLIAYNRNTTWKMTHGTCKLPSGTISALPRHLGCILPRSLSHTKLPKSEVTTPKSITPSHKEAKFTIWIPAILTTLSLSPTSTLLFLCRFALISSRFEAQFHLPQSMNSRVDEMVYFRSFMISHNFTNAAVSWKRFVERYQGYRRFEGHSVNLILFLFFFFCFLKSKWPSKSSNF